MDVHAVEAARAAAPPGVSFRAGAVEDLLPDALPADLVLLNPPRAGVAAQVPAALLASSPERILYVSCNPATLARDLKRLAPAYALESLRCFDLFPQTAHVETVAALRRSGNGTSETPAALSRE
jgi:23S rRNA (uracil1939-C5)-methyltransferase